MAKVYDLLVRARGETKDAERAMKQLQRSVDGAGKKMSQVGKTMTIGLTLPILGVAAASVKLASDAGETASKMRVTFGASMRPVIRQLDAFAKATGASRYQLREQATTIGALLKPMNLGAKATADMSVKVTKLATDLASFNNVPIDEALDSLKSGLTGETEPLKKFGILINEASVKAEALRLGLVKGKQELTEQQKVQARYSLILKQTADAQGDAARTSDSFANQMKATKNALYDTGVSVGNILLPALQSVLPKIQQAARWFDGLDGSTKKVIVGASLLAAAIGPVLIGMGALVQSVAVLTPLILGVTAPMLALGAAAVALGAATAALVIHERNKQNEFKRSAESALEQVRAMQTLKDIELQVSGSRIAVREASLAVERAERTYNEAVRQSGRKSLEAREAAVALQRARQSKMEALKQQTAAEKEANKQAGLNVATVFKAQTALRDEIALRKRVADLTTQFADAKTLAEQSALADQFRAAQDLLGKYAKAHKTNQKVVTEALERGVVTRRQLMDREAQHIAPAARSAGQAAGRAMGDGFLSSFGQALNSIGSTIANLQQRTANAAAQASAASGAAKAFKGKKRKSSSGPSGVGVLGNLFGSDVSVAAVLGYTSLSGGQPYSVASNGDGTETLNPNPAVVKFLEDRVKANTALLKAKIARRKTVLANLQTLSTAYNKLKREKAAAAKAKQTKTAAAKGKAMSANLEQRATLKNELEDLNSEILALGGQIQSDNESLVPPEIDTTPDSTTTDSSTAGDSSSSDASSSTGVDAINSPAPNPAFDPATWNPLMPTSVSALAAVGDSALHAFTGSGINITVSPNSADPEAIAQRVAFILGSSRLRAGGAF